MNTTQIALQCHHYSLLQCTNYISRENCAVFEIKWKNKESLNQITEGIVGGGDFEKKFILPSRFKELQ